MSQNWIAAILLFLTVRYLYKIFIEPGWLKSETRKKWKGDAPD